MTENRTSPPPLNNRAPAPEPVKRIRQDKKPCGCGKGKPARREPTKQESRQMAAPIGEWIICGPIMRVPFVTVMP